MTDENEWNYDYAGGNWVYTELFIAEWVGIGKAMGWIMEAAAATRVTGTIAVTESIGINAVETVVVSNGSRTGAVSNIISRNLRVQKQVAEHTIGGSRLGTKSYLNSIGEAESVLNAAHSGEARILSTNASQNRVYVEYNGAKGYYNNNGTLIETNKFLIKGDRSATVVPIHPNTTTFR